MVRRRLWITLAASALLIAACDSAPSGWDKKTSFDFTGTVRLYDEYRTKLMGTAEIDIRLKRAGKSTVADSAGNWRLTELPYEVRDTVVFTAAGYDTIEYEYYFTDQSTPPQIFVGMLPTPSHQVSLVSARIHPDGERIEVVGVASKRELEGSRDVVIFASNSPELSSALGAHDEMTIAISDRTEDTFVGYISLRAWTVRGEKLSSGDTVRIKAYPSADFDGDFSSSTPPRYANGYIGLGKVGSNVVTVVVP